jgi:hypothetical protein
MKIVRSREEVWRPSNSTLGEMFMEEFCERCANDTFDDETGEGESCTILIRLLIGETSTFVRARKGQDTGECRAFRPREGEGDE